MSVAAALVLIGVKLVTARDREPRLSSEAAHSGTDLVAALLTLFAVGVAIRSADPPSVRPRKAEHLSALAEASIFVAASLAISYVAIRRLIDGTAEVDATGTRSSSSSS